MFLLYPRVCVHCKCKSQKASRFCDVCQADFALLDPSQHCPYCFEESQGACSKCIEEKRFRVKVAAACDHFGAMSTFYEQVRKGEGKKMAASLLTVQFFRLKWEIPDLMIPIPSRGSRQFVESFAHRVKIPCHRWVKRVGRPLPQQRLPWGVREKTGAEAFYCKRDVGGKVVLLVDDLLGTGATVRAVASTLRGAKRIYALTLSRLSQR